MTIPTFPTLLGVSYPVVRSPSFKTIEHESVSGVTTTQSPQAFARYDYDLPYEFLRTDSPNVELQTLMSFFQASLGKALPFHFSDPDDNAIAGQAIGTGDGATTDFGLVRTMGSVTDPVQDAIAAGLSITVDGVTQSLGTDYSLLTTSQYGTIYGIRFAGGSIPGASAVTGTFSYNWLCRFNTDAAEFSKFMQYIWEAKSIPLRTVIQ
jgi:uncharacterized protein (TIGR02217 family)